MPIYTKQIRCQTVGPYVLDTKEEDPPNFLCSQVACNLLALSCRELPKLLTFQVSTEHIPNWHEGIIVDADPENYVFPCFDVLFNDCQYYTYIAMQDFLIGECGLRDKDHFWFQVKAL